MRVVIGSLGGKAERERPSLGKRMVFKTTVFIALMTAAMPAFSAVTFHLAYRTAVPESKPFDFRNDTLRYVANAPYLGASDLLGATVQKTSMGFVIDMRTTESAREKINKLVADNLKALHSDHPENAIALALLVDGEPKLSIQGMVHHIDRDQVWVEVSNEMDARTWADMINRQNEK